jgi:dihydrofolate synthase/folylpolyglutamate synthase
MAGRHQVRNLATALAALDVLRGMGWRLDGGRVWDGLSAAEWPGRLWNPPGLPPGVVLDGAHNQSGAEALAGHLLECGVRPHIFFSAMGDKDLAGMARALAAARPASVTLVEGDGSRCAAPGAMEEAWRRVSHPGPPLASVSELALKLRAETSDTYLVTGSLYFLGSLMREAGISL